MKTTKHELLIRAEEAHANGHRIEVGKTRTKPNTVPYSRKGNKLNRTKRKNRSPSVLLTEKDR